MFSEKIFAIDSLEDFEACALQLFRFQYEKVDTYRRFCNLMKISPSAVKTIEEIPFLPIQFFKNHRIVAGNKPEEIVFTSSGTTGQQPARHYVADLAIYEKSFLKAFEIEYGPAEDYVFLALLPSYLERGGSSLIYMVDRLIRESNNQHSGFYLDNMESLVKKIEYLESQGQKTILIGVSYALLDLLELNRFNLKHTIVMETGGMKGRRREMVKEELHQILEAGFGVENIHSEYGMTELLSQAYSKGSGIFRCPPWMKILTREPEDALRYVSGKTGGINVIDLANIHSCAFIATQDLGRLHNGGFEIIGRFDSGDIRGCNLMVL